MSNERDDQFEKLGKLDDLWRLHNRPFAEIKKQDPKAKVGGPAFTWPKPQWVEGFLKICGSNVDFVTWHNYASGDIYDSSEDIFNRTNSLAEQAKYITIAVHKATPGRKVECFLDEYNVKWVWDPIERRHGNNVGAVFQACLLSRLSKIGLDGVTIWHAKGNAYGLVGSDDSIRLKGRFYQIGSRCLVGSVFESAISGDKNLEAFAVKRADGVRSVLLINRADHTIALPRTGKLGLSVSYPSVMCISADGFAAPSIGNELINDILSLPGYSVTLMTEDQTLSNLLAKQR